jgi:hypothetical protein
MPLKLPNLDDRTYADLMEEARSLIPTYAPEWTNHNPSDPGITLVELFACLTEMLIYRLNRVADENRKKFLKLLNGPDWEPGPVLQEELRRAVLGLRERYRAVTCADFECLVMEGFNLWVATMQQREGANQDLGPWWTVTRLDPADENNLPSRVGPMKRVRCVPERYLGAGTEDARRERRPGHVSVIIVPDAAPSSGTDLQPTEAQQQAVWAYLDGRRLLTTRHHVVGPYFSPVSAEILAVRRDDVPTAGLRERIHREIGQFLDPFAGGPDRNGWPFGRDVYVSELYAVIENMEGVDYLPDIQIQSVCAPGEERCAAAEPMWHDDGELIGLRLAAHRQPTTRMDPLHIVIVPKAKILPLRLTIVLTAVPLADHRMLKRLVRTTVRDFFHPLHGGPAPDTPGDMDLTIQSLVQSVESLAGVQRVDSIDLQSDPERRVLRNQADEIVGLHVEAGEMVDLRLEVTVTTEEG